MGRDAIHIQELELSCCIGVPETERAQPQRLTVSVTMFPAAGLSGLQDELAGTVDYFAASRGIQEVARKQSRKLIETLAEEITAFLLESYPLSAVELELRKYILPDTAFVAIRLRRER